VSSAPDAPANAADPADAADPAAPGYAAAASGPAGDAGQPVGSAAAHPVLACAAALDTALTEVAGVDPVFMSLDEKCLALESLTELTGRLEALRMRVIAAAGDLAAEVGSRNVSSWLAGTTRTDRAGQRRAERLATDLAGRWPLVAAGLGTGAVNLDQAVVIVRALNAIVDGELSLDVAERNPGLRPGTELMRRCEAHLVELAGQFGPAELRRLAEKILEIIAPAVYEDEERKKLEAAQRRAAAATRFSINHRGDGTADLKGRIPESVASRLKTYLEAFTSPRHDAMQQAGCAGRTTPGVPLTDPATGQRLPYDRVLGEAFCAFLEAADPARMPIHGGNATKVIITLAWADLVASTGVATLGDGTRISVGEARRLLCNAGVLPAVLGGESQVLDLGREDRIYDGKQRTALGVQHPVCRAEHCAVPAAWCEAHHQKPWSQGGTTDLEDGVLLCPWHHHRAHDPLYSHEFLANGDVRFHRRR
jgi:hypothetical protein